MPISAKKKEQSSTSISFQIKQWFRRKKWHEELSNDKKETEHGFGSTKEIFYKKFVALEEQPLWLNMVMVQRNGIDTAFQLNHCYASFESGAQTDKPLGRAYLLEKVGKAIIEDFEQYVKPSPTSVEHSEAPCEPIIPAPIIPSRFPFSIDAAIDAMKGKDLVATSETGSRKTAAFILPALEQMTKEKKGNTPRVLILTPTREVATQITKAASKNGKFLRFNMVSKIPSP
jgi:hypothetical protein